MFFAVPTFYAAFLASPVALRRDELKLRSCVSAGEALPIDIGRRWSERYGVDILDGLGSTEMLHIFLSNRPGEVRYGTTGKPVPGYDIQLVGDDGRPVATGEMGELQVRGPTAARSCTGTIASSRARPFSASGRARGDKYVEDQDGYYLYCGRRDDMLKVGGIYVSPFEVEGALLAHPEVLEAAVVAWPDEDRLIKPKAFVVLKVHGRGSREALRMRCRSTASRSSRRTNIRAGSNSGPSCRRPATGRSSASNCAPRRRCRTFRHTYDLLTGSASISGRLSLSEHPWLAGNKVFDRVILAGTGMVELALAAGLAVGSPRVLELTLAAPLVVPARGGLGVQVQVEAADAQGRRALSLHSQDEASSTGSGGWTRHAMGVLAGPEAAGAAAAAVPLLEDWPPAGATPLDVSVLYARLSARGLDYGPAFQGLTGIWRLGEAIYGQVALPAGTSSGASEYDIHPALFDAALHVLVECVTCACGGGRVCGRP